MTFEFQWFLVVVQHLFVIFSRNPIQTFLVVLIRTYCSLVSDVRERSVKRVFRSDKGHEILDRTDRSGWDVESVVPQSVSCGLVVLFIFYSFLFCFDWGFFFGFFSRIPKIGVDWGEEYEDEWSSELNGGGITGPSLLTALAMCSNTNPGFFAFIMPLSSALNLRLHFLSWWNRYLQMRTGS